MTSGEQARADARADAETLGWIAFGMWGVERGSRWADIVGARSKGLEAVRAARAGDLHAATKRARSAARAAFRAVPGLRGDR